MAEAATSDRAPPVLDGCDGATIDTSAGVMPAFEEGAPAGEMVEAVLEVHDPDQLYVELAPAVLGYLRAQGVNEPDDVLGDVFVTVVRDLPRFRGDGAAARRWVFTIAHSRIVDERRRRRRRPVTLVPDPIDRVASVDRLPGCDPSLVDALSALNPEQRDVVTLRFVADLAVADVAHLLGKRPEAVRAQQHRALNRLAALLDTDQSPP